MINLLLIVESFPNACSISSISILYIPVTFPVHSIFLHLFKKMAHLFMPSHSSFSIYVSEISMALWMLG